MKDLKFTVVTVVLNGEKVIEKTLISVLNQTYSPCEYLLIDGESEDATLKIAHSFQERFAEKGIDFQIISERDTGIYNAMNKGIQRAKGDFISFLNAGDWYETDALEKINRFYQEEDFDLTYGGLYYHRPDDTVIIKMSKKDHFLISSRHWNHPSMFLKRELYQKYGFNENFKAYADFELYLKMRRQKIKVRVIDEVLTHFMADGVSTDTDLKKVMKRAGEKYSAYRKNGFSRIYWLESYGWELFKAFYFRMHKK